MVELRRQLEVAFDEVVARVGRVELRLATLRTNADGQASAAAADRDETLALLRHLVTTIDGTVAASHESAPTEAAVVDLGPVAVRLGQLDELLATKLTEGQIRLEGGLDQLHQQMAELRNAPIDVDTRSLEDAARPGTLHNAALRQTVEALTEAVRHHDKGIDELRTTLDWIKERLLR